MQEFHKAVEILEKYEFEFVDVSQVASANIIIKSPEILSHENGKKVSAKYQIVRAKHICDTQIKLAVIELLKSFEETEDLEFVTKHDYDYFQGKLGENDLRVILWLKNW